MMLRGGEGELSKTFLIDRERCLMKFVHIRKGVGVTVQNPLD